jgi:methyl-accepting chemotaxis protein
MSNEIRELKEHTRWLEDELSAATAAQEDLDDIKGQIGETDRSIDCLLECVAEQGKVINELVSKFNEVCRLLNEQTDAINKLINASRSAVPITPAASKSAFAENEAHPESFNGTSKPPHPKRQNFKPKVVANEPETQ